MRVAFQGIEGAYSHAACLNIYPKSTPIPCASFEEALDKVVNDDVEKAVIPIENSTAGRVADIHLLLPETDLFIIGEYFYPVHHCLMCPPQADFTTIKDVYSHPQALAQCRNHLRERQLTPHHFNDTAAAAKMVRESGDITKAAIASKLAAEIDGLKVLSENFQDYTHNTTRFVIFSKNESVPEITTPCITSFIFKVKNIPAALYKAMGGFAANGVNMLKLESYMVDGSFSATQFYVDIEGHKDAPKVQQAFKELQQYSEKIKILGCYPQNR